MLNDHRLDCVAHPSQCCAEIARGLWDGSGGRIQVRFWRDFLKHWVQCWRRVRTWRREGDFLSNNPGMENVSPKKSASIGSKYRRKERSLAVLTTRFLSKCVSESTEYIDLNVFAKEMGVPRRRLYDIINILENIGSTTRKGKASYYYNGPEQVHLTMSRLRDQPLPDNTSWSNMLFSECNDGERKTYTLGNLCKCFVSFLFNTPALSCTLDDFADTVFPLDESSPVEVFTAHKSCIRRLYDVVNVLIAFGVLEKVLRYRRNLFQIVIPLSNKNATGNDARESLTPEDVINEQPPLAEVTKISRLVFSTRLPSYQQDHKSAFQMLVDVAEHTPPPSLAIVKPSEIAMRHFDRIRSMGCLGDSNEFLARYQAVLQSWMVYQTTDRLFQ